MFLLGINLALQAGDEHYNLHRATPEKKSQISLECDSSGVRCLVYREDTVSKTNTDGIGDMKKQRKIVGVYHSNNVNRCPVRLTDKYISLCPQYFRKANFYLQPLFKTNPVLWYAEQVMEGINSICKVVKQMLMSADIDGYFTNHSLRCSGCTRLFQAGVERKIVKEVSGHRSDAIDKYQLTSERQRQEVSRVLATTGNEEKLPNKAKVVKKCDSLEDISDSKDTLNDVEVTSSFVLNGKEGCSCKKTYNQNSNNLSGMISSILNANAKNGKKARVKIEIEIDN